MATLPSRDQVLDELPEISEFRPIIQNAWQRWCEVPAGTRKDLSDLTRACMVHDFMVTSAVERLDGLATMHDKAKLKVFVIRNFAVRFKKLDAELMSRNQETQQVRDFMGQMALSGIETLHNLEVGYVLDPFGAEVVSTNVVCPNGYRNPPYWHIELHDEGYELSEITDLFPNDPPPNQPNEQEEKGARWKRRDSGVIIPFNRNKKPQ